KEGSMPTETYRCFGSYRLDLMNEGLWRGTRSVPLRPKPLALLRYLIEHAGRVVPMPELHQVLWPDTRVSQGVLKGYIHDLRIALGDNAQTPQFIETVGRRGYRFIGAVTETTAVALPEESQEETGSAAGPLRMSKPQSAGLPFMVGREAELRQLHGWLERML